jgi:hypothetical protein
MRVLLTVVLSCLVLFNTSTQAQNKSVNLAAVKALVGDLENAGVAFIGNDVKPYLDGTEKGFSAWGKYKGKTDVFIVFSDEMKALVQQKTKKKVVVGDSIGAYFNRSWRAQDFYTWIELKGGQVTYTKTSGRPADSNVERVQDPSDTRFAEFVTSVSETNKKVEVLVVGTMVDQAYLDTTDLSDEFKKLDRILSYVIVPSDKMQEAFSKITSKDIYVRRAAPEPGEEKSMADRMKWMIVEAKGSDLGSVRGSNYLSSILKPRSERGKH